MYLNLFRKITVVEVRFLRVYLNLIQKGLQLGKFDFFCVPESTAEIVTVGEVRFAIVKVPYECIYKRNSTRTRIKV